MKLMFEILAAIGVLVWIIWSIMAAQDLAEHKKTSEKFLVFEFAKHGDRKSCYLGDKMYQFLQDYNMGEYTFTRDIIEPAVCAAMEEYRKDHKLPD